MKKLIKSIVVAGVLALGFATVTEVQTASAATTTAKEYHVKAKLIGWADMNSFEAKTSKVKVYIMRTSNRWYYKNLKEGRYYTYFYKKNKYGQNIITKINK